MRRLIILFLFLLASCTSEKARNESNLKSTMKNFSKEACIDVSCAKVNLSWPEFEKGEVGNRLNQAIEEQLLAYFYSDSIGTSMDQEADNYLKSFKEIKAEFPDMPGDWEMEINARVSFDSLNTLTVFFEEYNFSGGAHPNSSSYFMNFDRSTGEFLSVDRLVLDQPALLSMAEKAFRDFHEIDENVTLEESEQFFLPETGFFLPNAMGFKGDKFRLIYIPYEIGPYAMGYTELEFSLVELKGIVRF